MKLSEGVALFVQKATLEIQPITLENYLHGIRHLIVWLRDPSIHTIKETDIIEYLNLLEINGLKHNSIVTKLAGIKRLWKFFNEKHINTFSAECLPVMNRVPNEPRTADDDQYCALLQVVHKERDRAIICLLWDTGSRCGELMSLNVKDIDTKEMKAVIRTEKSKGKKPFREIYWSEQTNRELKKWLKKRDKILKEKYVHNKEALFISQNKNKYGTRLTPEAVRMFFTKACHRAKIERISPHSFRHHMGHDLAKKGANNSIISSILGHASLASSFIYTELNNKEREEQYNKYIRYVSKSKRKR